MEDETERGHSSRYELFGGQWWRFNRYELVDGVIRPAQGAVLQDYHPWASHYETGAPKLSKLYQDFTALIEDLKIRPAGNVLAVDGPGEEDLLSWCSANGLLGILPHRTILVTLAASWQRARGIASERSLLLPTTVRYGQVQEGWQARTHQALAAPLLNRPDRDGEPLNEEEYTAGIPRPQVILHDLRTAGVEEQDLFRTWGRFFPSVTWDEKETFSYPNLLSDDFWQLYAEPLDEFLNVAWLFRDALNDISGVKISNVEAMTDQDRLRLNRGLSLLQALAGYVGVGLVVNPQGQLEQRQVCKSLLSTLAMMAIQDIGAAGRLNCCPMCGRYFTAISPLAKYCSKSCRYKAQKRVQRQRHRDKLGGNGL